MRSPFRYPGGKSWFVPYLRKWLSSKEARPSYFIEPFAGGGVASLTALMEGYVDRVIMYELDEDVAAVWKTILSPKYGTLTSLIREFKPTIENVEKILDSPFDSVEGHAFKTIVRNRVNRGGILATGAGKIKKGENDKGIASRWYPETLVKRIDNINSIKAKISFHMADGFDVLDEFADDAQAAFFIDPPYKTAGKRLYNHNDIDHELLLRKCSNIHGDFVITYESCSKILDMLNTNNLISNEIGMRNTHLVRQKELIISKNLTWLAAQQLYLWH